MEASFHEQNGGLRITLTGDLIGGADAMQFSQSMREALSVDGRSSVTHVAIDVSGVDFVNSAGLGMLLAARQSAMESGAKLSIQNPREQFKSLLDVTKLSEILGVTSESSVPKDATKA